EDRERDPEQDGEDAHRQDDSGDDRRLVQGVGETASQAPEWREPAPRGHAPLRLASRSPTNLASSSGSNGFATKASAPASTAACRSPSDEKAEMTTLCGCGWRRLRRKRTTSSPEPPGII